jgi:hypothetical protein
MNFFFSKRFDAFGLEMADYWQCTECGFVISKTHAELTAAEWERVNYLCHGSYQGSEADPGDPRWQARLRSQARVIKDLQQLGLLDEKGHLLDYVCGDGKLSDLVKADSGLNLLKYERFMRKPEGYLDDKDLVSGTFDFVITTSVFEHMRTRQEFDNVEALVRRTGVLGLHTLVCENVPADPAWYYMNPVHSSFHTNRSMEILLRQWGYGCSVYNVEAQLWLWFKSGPKEVRAIFESANRRSNDPKYVFKEGFVDYWKCAPYRKPVAETVTKSQEG